MATDIETGRAQIVERLEAILASRERYHHDDGPEDMMRSIRLQCDTLRSVIRIVKGSRYSMNGVAHSYDWDDIEELFANQGDPLEDW